MARRQPEAPTPFWQRARQIEEDLPNKEVLILVSKDDWRTGTCAGHIVEVTRFRAAQLIARETHQIASPAEVAAYQADIRKRQEDRRLADAKKDRPFVMYMAPPPDGAAPVDVQPPPPANKGRAAGKAKETEVNTE